MQPILKVWWEAIIKHCFIDISEGPGFFVASYKVHEEFTGGTTSIFHQ
jgi:hypothetical protein